MDNPLMSTYRKLPVDWEILPPEIWTLIFRHATLVPDLISVELCNYCRGDPMRPQQRKLHKRSLVSFMPSSAIHYYIVSRGRSKAWFGYARLGIQAPSVFYMKLFCLAGGSS